MCTPSAAARARPRTGARAVTMASTRPDHTVKVRLKIEQLYKCYAVKNLCITLT